MAENHRDDDRTQTHIPLLKGTMVGHYRIVEKIGAGGMGEVYLAEDVELDRKVALKFLPQHLCHDEDCRARFKREAQAAARLNHPNIIHVYEVSEYQGRPFFAMEHVEGQSLREFSSGRELSIEQVLELGIQICEGLHEAHDEGIIHRDIKPSNILIDSHGRAKIVDFGLASVVGTDQLTKTGSTLGTIGYMSPEQVQSKEIDQRSDLFSLGVVLYGLITKHNPFKRDSEAATLRAVIDDIPEPLARFKAGLPNGLQAIIDKALDKDIQTRYQHADGILSDLRRVKRSLESGQSVVSVSTPAGRSSRVWWAVAAIVVLAAVVAYIVIHPRLMVTTSKPKDKIMLAVLPFKNLGDPGDEYFADGMTDEITTSLAGLSGLGVISRTSAMQYKGTDKNVKEVGKELKVDYVLDGTIRWDKSGDGSRVRINPQLIRISDDLQLWADRYDAILTDVFAVQSTIAGEVAAALDVTLLQSERDALASRPDIGQEAYDYYLRGKQFFSVTRYRQAELRSAEKMHLQCIRLAPKFAPAYAELGALYTELHWDGIDTSQIILDSARAVTDIALNLAPDTPEPYQSLGWYYYHGLREFDKALDAFSEVLKRQPNNTLAIASIAWVERRQGKMDQAIEGLKHALQLDPREPWFYYELGNTYSKCRRFDSAASSYQQAINLDPHNEYAFFGKSWAMLNLTGDPSAAMKIVDSGLLYNPLSPTLSFGAAYYHLCAGQYDSAIALMTGPKEVFLWQYKNGADYYLLKGLACRLTGNSARGLAYLDSARHILEDMTLGDPNDATYQSLMGKTLAGLGRKDDAIAAGLRAKELLPIGADAMDGTTPIWDMATIYTAVGEFALAIEQLDTLFTVPSEVSIKWLAIAPEFIPLRNDPRFKALLEKYRNKSEI